nr:MAG TPA: hypothetical protein [Caudoviricetes sp.]
MSLHSSLRRAVGISCSQGRSRYGFSCIGISPFR